MTTRNIFQKDNAKILKLTKIRRDPDLQLRANTSKKTVAGYLEKLQRGVDLPPPVVFNDGDNYWLADGWHTFEALGNKGVREAKFLIKQGTKRDALIYALGANAEHGLPLTNGDKRKKVATALADSEWEKFSDGRLAALCAVSDRFVAKIKKEMGIAVTQRVGSDGRSLDTSKIGHGRATQETKEGTNAATTSNGSESETFRPQAARKSDARPMSRGAPRFELVPPAEFATFFCDLIKLGTPKQRAAFRGLFNGGKGLSKKIRSRSTNDEPKKKPWTAKDNYRPDGTPKSADEMLAEWGAFDV